MQLFKILFDVSLQFLESADILSTRKSRWFLDCTVLQDTRPGGEALTAKATTFLQSTSPSLNYNS